MDVVWLEQAQERDTVGPKAVYLCELHQQGIPVPRTFVIPPEFFESFLNENELYHQLEELYATQGTQASTQIRQKILRASMPSSLLRILLSAYEEIDDKGATLKAAFEKVGITNDASPNVAVKSSYIFPKEVPMPKKQITLLNATSRSEIIEALKHCWASLFSEELLALRKKFQLELFDLSTAILVQKMIYPRKSGILRVDPGSLQLRIQAGLGLGEAIASKLVEPDTYVLNKQTLQVESVNVQSQQWRFSIKRSEGKILKENLSTQEASMQVLSAKELQELARLFHEYKIQKTLCIEWCMDKKSFWVINAWKPPVEQLLPREESAQVAPEQPSEVQQKQQLNTPHHTLTNEDPSNKLAHAAIEEPSTPPPEQFVQPQVEQPSTSIAPVQQQEPVQSQSPQPEQPAQDKHPLETQKSFLQQPPTQVQPEQHPLQSPTQQESFIQPEQPQTPYTQPQQQKTHIEPEQSAEPFIQPQENNQPLETPLQQPLDQESFIQQPQESFLNIPEQKIERPEQTQDSFLNIPQESAQTEPSSLREESEPLQDPFSQTQALFNQSLHDASQLLATCDAVIRSALKEKHVQIYGNEPEERFQELVAKLQEHIHIPESVHHIRQLKQDYEDQQEPLSVEQITQALQSTQSFIDQL